jgi:hypothetical protein
MQTSGLAFNRTRQKSVFAVLMRVVAALSLLLVAFVAIQVRSAPAVAASTAPKAVQATNEAKSARIGSDTRGTKPRRGSTRGSEARIAIVNTDPGPIQVVVDGLVHTPRLPSGAKVEFVVELRRYTVEVRPVGSAATSNRQSMVSVDVLPSEMISFDASSTAIGLRGRTIEKRKPAGELAVVQSTGIRVPRGVSAISVLIALLSLGAGTALVLAQMIIERARVRDDRASARMQQMASQTLSSLPALSMDVAARTRRA